MTMSLHCLKPNRLGGAWPRGVADVARLTQATAAESTDGYRASIDSRKRIIAASCALPREQPGAVPAVRRHRAHVG